MKRLLRKKPEQSQQYAPSPAAQKAPPPPPPLFSRFASSHSSASSTSPPVISGPVPLAPRDSVHRRDGSHDGSPPKPSSTRVVSAPMQRNRVVEKQLPPGGGRDNKPLPDPEQTPTQKKPQKSIPEFRKRDDPSRNADPSIDVSPNVNKSEDVMNKLTRTSASSSPDRKPSSGRPAPAPETLSSGLLAFQHPPDRPQPRRKYSPLAAFGLVSNENSPVPSTTTSSVNLPSWNSISEPVQPSMSTASSDSLPSVTGENMSTASDIDTTPVKDYGSRRESLPVGTTNHDSAPTTPNSERLQRPQTADSSNEYQDSKARADQRTRTHHPLGPRSSFNRGPVQGQPRIFASMNTGTDFQQEPAVLKQGQPRIFAAGNGQDSQSWNTSGLQSPSSHGRGNQPQQEPPSPHRTKGVKGKSVDRSGVDSMPGFHQPQQQPEGEFDHLDNQTSPHVQTNDTQIRTIYTRAKSPAMQYRESLEKGKDRNRSPSGGKLAEPQSQKVPARRGTGPPSPVPLRKNSSGSSDGPKQRLVGPRGQSGDRPPALNLNGDPASKVNRRQSLYSPAVNTTTSVEEPELSSEPLIPSPKASPKTARSFGQQQRSNSAHREPGRYQPPQAPSSFNAESSPQVTNGYSSPVLNGSSSEPPRSRDSRGNPIGWHTQNPPANLSVEDPGREAPFTNNTSVSSERGREWSPATSEPAPAQNRPRKSTQPRRSENNQTRPLPTQHRSQERLGTTAINRGSKMDSFYGGDASLSGAKRLAVRNEEEDRPYPLELHLLHPHLLRALLQYLSFYDWCTLQGVNKNLRSQLNHARELKEEVLERYLSTIGYARWIWEEKEPLAISLRDLHEYMRGVSLPTHEYARIANDYLHARASAVSKEERMRHIDQARAMSFATRAYSRIIVRLRAQAEAVMAHGGAVSKLPGVPATGSRAPPRGVMSTSSSRAPSPSSRECRSSRPPDGQKGRMVFASPIYQPRRAPLLRVFVPSPEEWLSDANVVECESELNRAGILHMLRPGDAVWDIAVGDEGNAGKMVWDGNFLLDLDYTYSTSGDLPRYLPSLAFAPSYFHKVLRINGNPVVHIDLNPWSEEIAMNLQLLQDRVKTETSQGTYHNVIRWVHRSTFQIYPQSAGEKIPFQFGSGTWHVDPGWYGTVVVEAEGTNEGLADLQSRCHSAFPARSDSEGQGSRDEERKKIFRILRERSKPGEIWIRTVGDKERLIP